MSDNIEKFYPKDAAKSADNVLEQSVGVFGEVLVIGWDKGGELDARATRGLKDGAEVLWLIEAFKANLLAGVYGEDEGE